MKLPQLKIRLLALLVLGIMAGCQKSVNDDLTPEDETELSEISTEDDEVAAIYDDVFEMVTGVDGDLGFGDSPIFGETNDENYADGIVPGNPPPGGRCVTITVSPGGFPKRVVFDFGTGCTGPDGRTRKGKIIATYTQRLGIPGAEVTTRFEGYYINDNKIEGVHITKNESTSSVRIMTRVVREGKITRPNGNYAKWSGKHTTTQVEGLGTPTFLRDDAYTLTGGAEGERKVGDKIVKWSRLIVSPVFKAVACKWPSKGEVRITRNDVKGLLNYGNGECDNKATVTINGRTRDITLR